MSFSRLMRHLFTTRLGARRCFTSAVLADIETAIRDVESRHSGEIRFVIEPALEPLHILRGLAPRERAVQLFSHLGVWDTQNNNGVLIYVLLADRDVEILADRGIAERVPQADWEQVCHEIEAHYRAGRFGQGSVAGIQQVGLLLARHFPGSGGDPDELPNQPVLL
jgi:uncharacterized membrane protein